MSTESDIEHARRIAMDPRNKIFILEPSNDPAIIPWLKNELISCPACAGQPTLDEAVCAVCRGNGQIRIKQLNATTPAFYETLDGTKIIESSARPRSLSEDIQRVQEHLADLVQELGRIKAGAKQYHVPVVSRSALDGGEERTIRVCYGRTEQEAIFNATHDAQRMQWAKQDGKPTLVGIGPAVTFEWIDRALALML